MERYYNYNEVAILPQYSEVKTRKDVDVGAFLNWLGLNVPIISSNMDTVTEWEMAVAMWKSGAAGALHRFMPIEENVNQYEKVLNSNAECIVSIGVSGDYKERAAALWNAGARFLLIDIAHGHSLNMKNAIKYLKEKFSNCFVIAGNVGTPNGVIDLQNWGADAIKIGIAGGKVCITKDVTGVHTPMFTTLQKCSKVADVPLIADGGCRSSGDVAKAIGAGADFVMSGFLFSSCVEAPHAGIYRGMASQDAMNKIKVGEMPTPEGTSISVDVNTTAEQVVKYVRDGLRSSFSYVGADNMKDFQKKVEFIYRSETDA